MKAIGFLAAAVCLCTNPSFAQSPHNAAITVMVTDPTGAVVRDATVSIVNTETGATRDAISGPDGSATVPGLPIAGTYTVTVSKQGFVDEHVGNLLLRAGENATVRVKLTVGSEKAEVTVYGTAEGVRAQPQLGMRLDAAQIEQTPLLGRKVTGLPLLNSAFRSGKGTGDLFINQVYAVSGAGGRREIAFAVDGAGADEPWGRQTMFSIVPAAAVQEMTVLSNAFSAEFGWTAAPAVNVVTKSGTNHVRGEVQYLERPGSWQESTATSGDTTVVPADVPDVLHQISAAAGGALVRDQTFWFAAGEFSDQHRTSYFSGAVPPALLNGVTSYVGNYRQGLLDARVDHKLNAQHTLMMRFNLDRFADDNPQDVVSGTTLPSAGRDFQRHTSSFQVNETAVMGAALLNEARVEYQHGDPITDFDPLTPTTQFVRSGVSTEGESRYSHVYSKQLQFSDTVSWTRGSHYLRLGGSLSRHTSGGDGTEFGGAFVLGQFTINPAVRVPIDELTITDATRYTQTFDFGVNQYTLRQWIYTLFAQDSLRLGPDLTLDLGLRYDRQTFSDGTKNLAPRVGFGWHPGGEAATAVRGGYGVYYTMLRANTQANFTLNGPEGQFTYSVAPGQLGFPSSLTAVPIQFPAGAVLPARNITIRPGRADYYRRFLDISRLEYPDALVNPKSQVGSIGIERDLGHNVVVSADYVKQHWSGLDRSVDLNAPSLFARTVPGQLRSAAAADATRPIAPVNNGFRQINVVENLGVADYDGLQTMVRWHAARAFASLSYTLSKATNTTEPNGNGPNPNDFNQLGEEERGPSILDQRHRAVISASYRLPYDVTAGTLIQLASARPYNATTGVDNNGDGSLNDRPVIDGEVTGRASFRGTPIYDTALFAEVRIPLSSRSLALRVEGFNVFNHANVLGRTGVYGNGTTPSATFGSPGAGLANIDPARQFQLLARFVF
ncbi:MAG: TonB-dependent receptor domain-containing protein [Acidobacteriota bacterium]